MLSSWTRQRAAQAAACVAIGLGLAVAPALSAITVTNVGVKAASGPGVIIYYTLNEPATSVQVSLSNGTNLTGGVAKGVNEVSYNGAVSGVSGTILAIAPAENGTGGANLIVPVSSLSSANIVGVDFFTRSGSPYRGEFVLTSQSGSKPVSRIAGDGTVLKSVNLSGISSSGSFPFGLAVAESDSQDRIWINQRSGTGGQTLRLLSPADLTLTATLPANYMYTGLDITAVTGGTEGQFNAWVAGDNSGATAGGIRHYTADLSVTPPTNSAATTVAISGSGVYNSGVAVDSGNTVMFKTDNAALGDAGTTSTSLTKWTSGDSGATWVADDVWNAAVTTSIGVAAGIPRDVVLAAGFDANDLANSYVWISVAGTGVNKIFKVNASTGAVDAASTIDLAAVTVPEGGESLGDKPVHYIASDHVGNLAVTVGGAAYGATHYAVVGPNTASATSDVAQLASVEPPLSASGSVDVPSVGNTGNATVHYAIDVFDSAGIVADNVQVNADLTAIGGGAAVALTRGTVSADGKSATYTNAYLVPANATLGTSNIPFTVSAASGSTVVRVAQAVYNALIPAWEKSVAGKVTGVASSGATTYVATDAGNVYAFGPDGTPDPNFGAGSGVSVGEAVAHGITAGNGRLYVPGTTKLFVLDLGSGAPTGSFAVANPSSAAISPVTTATVFVGGGDNKVHALDASSGAQKYASADLGSAVNEPSIGPSFLTASLTLLVAGTEGGNIVMLNPDDLTEVFPAITDSKGAVRSKAAFGLLSDSSNYFAIGGASGLWAVPAESGVPYTWATDATHNGSPYGTPAPVDADPVVATFPSSSAGVNNRIMFGDTSGNFYVILSGDGGKLSFASVPTDLSQEDGGFEDGAGVLVRGGTAASDGTTNTRIAWLGTTEPDGRFFSLSTLPDDSTYTISPQTLRVFDPGDTATYPGETAGGFPDAPVATGDKIVVGSTAGRVYAFADSVTPKPYVSSVTPANGASGAASNQVITATYNTAVTYGSMPVIQLLQNGQDVAGSYELSVDGLTLTFTPSSPLTDKTAYAFVVRGLTNADGSVAAVPFSSTFFVGTPAAVQGDVNGNGVFDLQDAAEALRIAGGVKAATAKAVTATGDKVTPGSITVEDAVFLARVKAGLASF